MRFFKYLIGIWTAILVYSLFSLLSGPRGLTAYNQLLAEQQLQMSNLKDLGTANEELEKTKNSLLYDQDTLFVYARQLGYGQEDERYVRIVGLGGVKNLYATAGKVYYAASPEYIPEKTVKIAALCTGLVFFAFFFVLELIQSREK